MFDDFEEFDVATQTEPRVVIHGRRSSTFRSDLPPILLLHGFPQNHRIWHKIAPMLTSHFNVSIMDLRGYGASSKPGNISAYAKSAMAKDCIAVMKHHNFESFFICGHDRGARVAHKLCVDYPEAVRKAIFLDICPTLAMYTKTDFEFARAYFHWFFLIQEEPMPERAISSNPEMFADFFMGGEDVGNEGTFDPTCYASYERGLRDPSTIHAMCQDYRAGATLDLDEARYDLAHGNLMQCPLRVVWAKNGVIEKCFDPIREWKMVSRDGSDISGQRLDCGHFIPEEVPQDVVAMIMEMGHG